MPIASLDEIRARIGEELGTSSWITVDQARIDAFADATEEWQFIHVDAEAAAQTPFGGTVAHGFLTLSLISHMGGEVMLAPPATGMTVNYGLDRIASWPRSGPASESVAASGSSRSRRRAADKYCCAIS